MSTPDAAIYVDLDGETHLTGFLWIASGRRGSLTATFRYAESWLEHPSRFAIDPLLDITSAGSFYKDRLFGALADSAPDRLPELAMDRPRVQQLLEGRTVKKVIPVGNKLVNIVA